MHMTTFVTIHFILIIGLIALFLISYKKNIRYLHRFKQAYENDLVILDTETTGLDVFHDDIIQTSAVRIKLGKEIGQPFNVFIESEKPLPLMLGNEPNPLVEVYNSPKCKRISLEEGLGLFMEFVKDLPILGHNIEFDYDILFNNMKRANGKAASSKWTPIRFDTLRLAKILFPFLPSYKLSSLKKTLCIFL